MKAWGGEEGGGGRNEPRSRFMYDTYTYDGSFPFQIKKSSKKYQ